MVPVMIEILSHIHHLENFHVEEQVLIQSGMAIIEGDEATAERVLEEANEIITADVHAAIYWQVGWNEALFQFETRLFLLLFNAL